MRVLVVSLGRRGGIPEYGWLMGRALAARTEVAVIHSAFAQNASKWESLDCPRLGIRTFRGLPGLMASFLNVRRFWAIWRFVRSFAPDVVYYPGGHPWKPVLDFLMPSSATVILTVHDPELHEGAQSLPWRLLDWLNRRRVSAYVLLNEAQSGEFKKRRHLKDSEVAVIPHGVFDDHPDAPEDVPDVLDVAPISPADVGRYVLFFGRIEPYKGIGVLLEAYAGLEQSAAGALVIAGSGEFSAEQQAFLAELRPRPVYLVNRWVSAEEMSSLVSSARFVVLPYTSATQSGVIPLASAFGVPALASATGGLVEQVVDGETGLLFPPSDVDALADALRTAYTMDELTYARMSAACRDHAASNWDWDVLAARLLEFAESR